MTAEARRRVRARAAAVAADGTDPDLVVAVLGWLVRPRRSPDALRRRCRDGAAVPESPRQQLRAVVDWPEPQVVAVVDQTLESWSRLGVRVALVGDPDYPRALAAGWPHTDGPPLLARRGEPHPSGPAAAIVGARRASGYGTGIAAWLAEAVAGAGARVVSGGAVGIDAAAHRAAVELPGGTSVVLGCGHAVDYPRTHAAPDGLFDRVLAHGGTLLGELLPHQRPIPAHVRGRNRIVAALVDAVVVVEGGTRSGALLTASAAADRGVPVLAVPGDVRAPGSSAPHRLLADGAAPCTGPRDLLDCLGATRAAATGVDDVVSALPADLHRVLTQRWPRPTRVDELARLTGRPVAQLLAALTRARLDGELAEGADGVRLRRSP